MSAPVPICVSCRLEMRVAKNNRLVRDPAAEGLPGTYWLGDEYECPQCHLRIVTGFGDAIDLVPVHAEGEALEFAYERPPREARPLPKGLHKVRHDCEHLFCLKLLPQPGEDADTLGWDMMPCLVQLFPEMADGAWPGAEAPPTNSVLQWFIARHPYQLLDLPDETEVICPWPGAKRCDVFRFTVGEFRVAWGAGGGA